MDEINETGLHTVRCSVSIFPDRDVCFGTVQPSRRWFWVYLKCTYVCTGCITTFEHACWARLGTGKLTISNKINILSDQLSIMCSNAVSLKVCCMFNDVHTHSFNQISHAIVADTQTHIRATLHLAGQSELLCLPIASVTANYLTRLKRRCIELWTDAAKLRPAQWLLGPFGL